ncbi:hypothetical protein [Desulfitobacterium hafniense]|nr:hypothetical protein [Desulfitobacterium hafniense]
MCFRPPNVSKPKVCPDCGAQNPPIRTTCLKCNADLNLKKPESKEEKE